MYTWKGDGVRTYLPPQFHRSNVQFVDMGKGKMEEVDERGNFLLLLRIEVVAATTISRN